MVGEMVSAAILILLFVDTIITAFLLGKYRSILKEVRSLPAKSDGAAAPAPSLSATDIQAAMDLLRNNG